MTEPHEQSRLRDEENRDEFAIRRLEREMTGVERALERELSAFERDERETERRIEAEWRRERWGHDPERSPAWRRPSGADTRAQPGPRGAD